MKHDFDNAVQMRVLDYDAERARDLLEALVDLCLEVEAMEPKEHEPAREDVEDGFREIA